MLQCDGANAETGHVLSIDGVAFDPCRPDAILNSHKDDTDMELVAEGLEVAAEVSGSVRWILSVFRRTCAFALTHLHQACSSPLSSALRLCAVLSIAKFVLHLISTRAAKLPTTTLTCTSPSILL
jgi:hypothetical protein